MPYPKTVDRNALRRAAHWKAKPVKKIKVRVDGKTTQVAIVRKVDDDMRQWITQEEIDAATLTAANDNR